MSYFEDHYPNIRYPISSDTNRGLRKAQIGAIHAVGAHLTQDTRPGIIVLPTGSGKTAVLMMSAFLARARRVLILTPSRLVRSQIARDFGSLVTLKRTGVLDMSVPAPRVFEMTERISTVEQWESLRGWDVAVGTPNSMSPEYEAIPDPPSDLFDLMLVDEAHHVPARTWHGVLEAFEAANRFLFTATPFRRDEKEIRGKLIYVYRTRDAYDDGIFSDISFEAVYPTQGQSNDVAIALAAEAAFYRDREAGLDHRLMIRTDRKTRGQELQLIYDEFTELRLQAINSNHSLGHVQRVLRRLRDGDLDGVICVDMLGEGVDIPNLKLAAVHTPHRSLEVTLQFIGRFARTGSDTLGQARFFAVPAEIHDETERLYKDEAVWGELVHNLAQARIDREQTIRETLERFRPPNLTSEETFDLSLAGLRPYFHVKIYRVATDVDISAQIQLASPFEVIYHTTSEQENTAVFIIREFEQPRWTSREQFTRTQYDLFVVLYDTESRLLFINSSLRSTAMYEAVARSYTLGAHQILSLARVNRVLADISDPEFFNVGMKNTLPNSPTESYRIVTGPRADKAIQETDGRMFHRGHVFGKGTSDGEPVTIGYSSGSKVWSNRKAQIPELVAWCRLLVQRISSDAKPAATHSGLDNLAVGEEIEGVPNQPVIAADWHESAYRSQIAARYFDSNGAYHEPLLVDLKVEVDRNAVTRSSIPFRIVGDGLLAHGNFRLDGGRFMFELDPVAQQISLTKRDEGLTFAEWLRNYPADFYFADFSRLRGAEFYRAQITKRVFSPERVAVFDWLGEGVDIEREVGDGAGRSIHEFVREQLIERNDGVVIYDHRTWEVADFVQIRHNHGTGDVVLFHIKASSSPIPGDRVDDVYEVCGQVVRSLRWFHDLKALHQRLERRLNTGSQIVVGDQGLLSTVFRDIGMLPVAYKVVIVQPGLSQAAMDGTTHALAAADDYLVRANAERLEVWGSP